ncbi:dTDP-4-dehydrorhamnose reductase family protein [Microbulbifer variabilis]|uniref:dTDP-4-dehydrorhamnose reductase family protein n=1 Tax=Microbulbifer variabilis TaxID=266805 RepID=UPI00037E258E|nr:SDR family oxidoreductase [Microbulbifer variabilis]
MRILILGVTGMLGSAVYRTLTQDPTFEVWGTLRSSGALRHFEVQDRQHLLCGIDVLDQDTLVGLLDRVRPNVIVNCVGLIKQLSDAEDPLSALPINAMLPHRLSKLCGLMGARLIHVSTDCVFSGRKGMYSEVEPSDAEDLYGKSKFIGEIDEVPHAITLRTSIIGHELTSSNALIDWFLSQTSPIKGYAKAIFSGLPTVELARIIKTYVIPNPELQGLYHVSAEPIDKLSLLQLVAEVYGHSIEIVPDEQICLDRSLDSSRFREAAGYQPPVWLELVKMMHEQR